MLSIIHQDNLDFLKTTPDNSVDLIYSDLPFNTKKRQTRDIIKGIKKSGVGFEGYSHKRIGQYGSYDDNFDDFLGFIVPRLEHLHRVLKHSGSIYIHLDYREVHYVKVEMDKIFGRDNFLGEIIWSFEFGAKSKKKWSMKHNNILYYVKDKKDYTFNYDKVPRVPYLAPGLVGPEKAAIGKTVCSVWWHTIVGTNSKEKMNYATQKPVGLLKRIVEVSSNENDVCMDVFAGSGSFGQACLDANRKCILVDSNKEAIEIMNKRFNIK